MCGKGVLEIILGGVEGKVSDKQFIAHMMFYCPTNCTFHRLFPNTGLKTIIELSSPEDSPCLEGDELSNRHTISNRSPRISN
jgi:hypothetical protein